MTGVESQITGPGQDGTEPLYSLVAGEGDGVMLGVVAGDAAGGAWELGYSAITQQVTVVAYQLIERRRLDTDALAHALRELDGTDDEDPVYRGESAGYRSWLDDGRQEASVEGAARATVVGVAFRRDPDAVIEHSRALGRMFYRDTASVSAGLVAASAAAASCFGQTGRDLLMGVSETIRNSAGFESSDGSEQTMDLQARLEALGTKLGIVDGEEALEAAGAGSDDPLSLVLAGLLLAAPVTESPHTPIEQAARIGGSSLGAAIGGIMGARVGIRAWPWAFPNDTWFAEIGRRLVRGPKQILDLPIPYAVEQHLNSGERPGFH